nr:hypothetical protein CFP56_02582 [Quercus suber]
MTASRHIAFFGATGGCANNCLALALQAGHTAMALVRSPQKLRQQLAARGVSATMLENQLRIVQGNIKNLKAVLEVLRGDGRPVDTIVSGIGKGYASSVLRSRSLMSGSSGGVPAPQFSLLQPLTMTDPAICSVAVDNILTVLAQTERTQHPLLVVISANGVLDHAPRDYPLALTPLYRWLLCGIYDDKRKMEAALERAQPAGKFLIVRPSVLSDGNGKGLAYVRQGDTQNPVLGYGISRHDVGLWIFENVIRPCDRSSILNIGVNITYRTDSCSLTEMAFIG